MLNFELNPISALIKYLNHLMPLISGRDFMKAQTSIEMLIVIAVSLVVLVAVVAFAGNQIGIINQQADSDKAQKSVEDLRNAVREVYAEGSGAKKPVFIEIPHSIDPILTGLEGEAIVINIAGSDFIAETGVTLAGSIPTEPGGHNVWVEAREGFVFIGLGKISLDKESVYITMPQSSNASDSILVTNNSGSGVDVFVSSVWPHSEVTLNPTPASFSIIDGGSGTINLGFSSSAAAVGNYAGSLEIDVAIPDGDENLSIPLNAEVLVGGGFEPLIALPSSWSTSISAGGSDFSTFTICNTLGSSMANVTFTPSNGGAGDWVQAVTPIAPLNAESCVNRDITISVPGGTSGGTYYGTITVGDGTYSDTISLEVIVAAQLTADIWALFNCDWALCDSTANVTGAADNVYDSGTNNLGGRSFDVAGLSGTIDSVTIFWSHEIPPASSSDSITETTVADFSDGTFISTQTYSLVDGEVGLSSANSTDVETTDIQDGSLDVGNGDRGQGWAAQTFVPSTDTISGTGVYLTRVGNSVQNVVVYLRDSLEGGNLATATIPYASITSSWQWIDAIFPAPETVTPGDTYYLVLDTAKENKSNYYLWGTNTGNLYPDGIAYQETTAIAGEDALLRTYYSGYATSGTYISNDLDLGSIMTVDTIDATALLNGQTLTVAYQLSDDGAIWGGWSSEYSTTPVTVNQTARYVRYRATYAGDGTASAYLASLTVNASSSSGPLSDDVVEVSYAFDVAFPEIANTYNFGNTPVDLMDSDTALIEIYDATAQRPGGGAWQWSDFANLRIGGRYIETGAIDSEWRLDAVGVRIAYTP